jgi:dGTPase
MDIRSKMLKYENTYGKYASFDKDAVRLEQINEDFRPNYFRDIDRIIHSAAYTRYMDKTQVFTLTKNDNISKRMVHVQLVSKIARTIGRALSLNEDLIEAIALGHDLGHVPYGHEGEKILNQIALKHNEGYFNHNVQSVRELMVLENNGNGTNLTIQVLDGILCHNGELELKMYKPKKKSIDDFLNDYYKCYKIEGYTKNLVPMTLEGCVVRISDIIAYLGRDIEDAEKLGVFDKDKLPSDITSILGNTNKQIIDAIINDIIKNSMNKSYIMVSDDVFKAISDLRKFNNENIYMKAHSKEELDNYNHMFNDLFDNLLDTLNKEKRNERIYQGFLNGMSDEYLKNTSNERKVIDYIAGMTDEYFISEYKQLCVK